MLLFTIIVIAILSLSGYAIYLVVANDDVVNTVAVSKTIENWNYTLDDRDTDLMQEEFNNLNTILLDDTIDYEEYAKSLAKLYIIDLYTINNKINYLYVLFLI